MRIYSLVRSLDQTGISGTGIVAQLVEFDSGKVSVAWCAEGRPKSVAVYDSLDEAKLVHGHSGSEFILLIDTEDNREAQLASDLREARELASGLVRRFQDGTTVSMGEVYKRATAREDLVNEWSEILESWKPAQS